MSESCSESSTTFILCVCEKRKPWWGHGYVQPLPHVDVIRTSCADQFIWLK